MYSNLQTGRYVEIFCENKIEQKKKKRRKKTTRLKFDDVTGEREIDWGVFTRVFWIAAMMIGCEKE